MYKRGLIHLRKSRADLEAEARGEGETLSKHRKALLKLAKELRINIINIREELESGESLIHRPEMLLTLQEVESGMYDCVLCMDIDRLGRGDMQDQGLILKTFKNSKTHIVTPRKTYNLDDEFDEEYSEFEAFMARKELKIINRRLQGGRIRSVEEGNYIGTRPPFGYLIETNGKGNRYLIPHPDQAPIVKMIFQWYTERDIGCSKIAQELNNLGYKSYTGKPWKPHMVINLIKNSVYAGRIQWKKKEYKKSTTPGKRRDSKTRPVDEWIDVEGKHEALVSLELFNKAQDILNNNSHVPYGNTIKNSLAGLVKCAYCGSSMAYRPYSHQKYPHLICYNTGCPNKSSRYEYVEQRIIEGLSGLMQQYKLDLENNKEPSQDTEPAIKFSKKTIANLQKELSNLEIQNNNLHDLLEQGVYTIDKYLERSKTIGDRIENIKLAINEAEKKLELELRKQENKAVKIPKVESVLDLYYKTDDPIKRNSLLKTVLNYTVYKKEQNQKNDEFTLTLYPRI